MRKMFFAIYCKVDNVWGTPKGRVRKNSTKGVKAATLTTQEATPMPTVTFDTLGYVKKLEAAGFTRQQAETQATAFREFTELYEENARKELATKMDVMQTEMRLTEKMESNKHEMLKWMAGMFIAQTAALVAIVAFVR